MNTLYNNKILSSIALTGGSYLIYKAYKYYQSKKNKNKFNNNQKNKNKLKINTNKKSN